MELLFAKTCILKTLVLILFDASFVYDKDPNNKVKINKRGKNTNSFFDINKPAFQNDDWQAFYFLFNNINDFATLVYGCTYNCIRNINAINNRLLSC